MENSVLEKNNKKVNQSYDFLIIGIGASAGGLKALEEFFDYCPSDTGFAFVIIQHLSPNYKSLMSELLSRHTTMGVKEAKEGDVVSPNNIYLIPGTKNIQIKKGKLELEARPPNNQINFSIDLFFKSLSYERKDKAIAIILSGTGSDGTMGAKTIKSGGGTIFVQTPDSSGFDGMPKSVIDKGIADFILEPKDMAKELIDYTSQIPEDNFFPTNGQHSTDDYLNLVIKTIKDTLGFDFSLYKRPTLMRRTTKRIYLTKSETIEEYITYLNENKNEQLLLCQEYLIGVTHFFRDREAFEILKKDVLPDIVSKKAKGESIKIWIVACSTGEEAYSIAILLDHYLKTLKLDINYKVFATDINSKAIEKATKGVFNLDIASEIPAPILKDYFIKEDTNYIISPNIRRNIIFSQHDILRNPPFNKMDLVTCRNMLIYMQNSIQLKVLSNIHYGLNLNGYLFLGSSENLGPLHKNFEKISNKWKIYKNIQSERILDVNNGNLWRINSNKNTISKSVSKHATVEDKVAKAINKTLMNQMQAASICIDENFEIIHAVGKLKKYIQYPDEGYSNNLLKILPEELSLPISVSTRKIANDPTKTIEKKCKLLIDDQLKQIKLVIASVDSIPILGNYFFLITLIEELEIPLTEIDKASITTSLVSNDDQIKELKEALKESQNSLQYTVEELETSSEEMQATNEELLASNEELQSTNEELQSLNEELHTVNAELQEKNVQLLELNSDVENLMKNINIGTIFLDHEFCIRKFTPAIKEHFQLRPQDIGRSITHFYGTMGGGDLVTHSKKVIDTLTPLKKEVCNTNGKCFIMQISPYKSQEEVIQGVAINFLDISDLKSAIDEKEKLNGFLSHLMKANPAMIYIFDIQEKKNIYSSSNFTEVAGYNSDDLEKMGGDLLNIIIHPDDLGSIYAHHDKLKHIKNEEILQIEYRVKHKSNEEYIWFMSSDKIYERNDDGSVKTILGANQIITRSKEMKAQLKKSEERFRLAISATKSGLWEWSNIKKDEAWFSKEFYELLGFDYTEKELGFIAFINLIHPEHTRDFRTKLKSDVKKGRTFEKEIQIKTKTNGYKWFKINGQVQYDLTSNKIKKIVGTLLNIDTRKADEQKMKELNVELERFAYLASHDLKEPLRTVTSFTKLFKDEYKTKFDDTAFTYLNFIENASSRMITLTNDLLVYSQLDDKSLNFENVNLNTLISKIEEDLFNVIIENKAVIRVEKLPYIICDQLQIKQLFQNLISNSLKYRSQSIPEINISCCENEDDFEFCVMDNGIGITKKHHIHIFEVFKRLHSQSEYEGTGIGLANCKRIIDNHKGKIWVESEKDKGSKFCFLIPKLITK